MIPEIADAPKPLPDAPGSRGSLAHPLPTGVIVGSAVKHFEAGGLGDGDVSDAAIGFDNHMQQHGARLMPPPKPMMPAPKCAMLHTALTHLRELITSEMADNARAAGAARFERYGVRVRFAVIRSLVPTGRRAVATGEARSRQRSRATRGNHVVWVLAPEGRREPGDQGDVEHFLRPCRGEMFPRHGSTGFTRGYIPSLMRSVYAELILRGRGVNTIEYRSRPS